MIYESYFKPFIHIIYYYCTITVVYNKLFSPAVVNVIRINISVTLDSITYCRVVCRWRKGFIVRKIIILPTRTTRNWLYFCTSEFSRRLSVSPTNRIYCTQYNIVQVWYSMYNVHIQCAGRAKAPRRQGRNITKLLVTRSVDDVTVYRSSFMGKTSRKK